MEISTIVISCLIIVLIFIIFWQMYNRMSDTTSVDAPQNILVTPTYPLYRPYRLPSRRPLRRPLRRPYVI